MYIYVDVNTGEVKTGSKSQVLVCRALGSCVAVVLFDSTKNIGGTAHIMLPGKMPAHLTQHENRYAESAIPNLLQKLKEEGAEHFRACIAGGANVLHRLDDSICGANIKSIKDILTFNNIEIVAESIGGFERRSLSYFFSQKRIAYTIGDSKEKLLLDFN